MSQKSRHPNSPDVDTRHAIGPTSISGAEASEFPDERGSLNTEFAHEAKRKLPQQTGGMVEGDVGMAAMPDSADARDHGGRKRN
jgi:hypothetical protein